MFFFNDTSPTEIYTLSLHDALPIFHHLGVAVVERRVVEESGDVVLLVLENPEDHAHLGEEPAHLVDVDRKSTRLNSSHTVISYAVFCLKKKIKNEHKLQHTKNNNTQ